MIRKLKYLHFYMYEYTECNAYFKLITNTKFTITISVTKNISAGSKLNEKNNNNICGNHFIFAKVNNKIKYKIIY